jgi:2-C-methyl-D-erythritol 4-phosphate cytidylyltransferase
VDGVWAIVVAAGSGDRFGGAKQFEPLGGRRVVDWSLAAARRACDGVVLVVPRGHETSQEPDADVVVAGADTRSGSVRAGLAAVPEAASVIAVHDAVRPLASDRLWAAVIERIDDVTTIPGSARVDGAIPAVPVSDTLRRIDGGTIDRAGVVAVQTPQAFRADILRRAHVGRPDATDDAALVEAIGGRVVLVDGERDNLKITSADDLRVLAALMERGR